MPVARALQTSRESVYVFFFVGFVLSMCGCICRQRQQRRQQRVHVCAFVYLSSEFLLPNDTAIRMKNVFVRARMLKSAERDAMRRASFQFFFLYHYFYFGLLLVVVQRECIGTLPPPPPPPPPTRVQLRDTDTTITFCMLITVSSLRCVMSTTDKIDDSKPLAYVHAKFALRQMSVCLCTLQCRCASESETSHKC